MKIFFDESGQTGCVIKKDDLLNFKSSPTFALAAIVVNDNQIQKLEEKYLNFKKKFSIEGEIKGTDLLKKNNNDKLYYFINNILNETNIYINIYDKRFYLSTLILFPFCGIDCLENFKLDIYNQASILARQDDSFFIEYLNFIDKPNLITFRRYLKFLINFDYKFFKDINDNVIENALLLFAKKILKDKLEESFINDFMTYGWYKDKRITNLINLNCLCELIYIIKDELNISGKNIEFIHDNIHQFEGTIKDVLSQYNFNIRFEDSKKSVILQTADNIASIFRHSFDKAMEHCANNKMWIDDSLWDLKLFSKIQHIITTKHIKYTVSLPDLAASLSIRDMFSDSYPKAKRNNMFFNSFYTKYFSIINRELLDNTKTLKDVEDILNA